MYNIYKEGWNKIGKVETTCLKVLNLNGNLAIILLKSLFLDDLIAVGIKSGNQTHSLELNGRLLISGTALDRLFIMMAVAAKRALMMT